MQASVDGSRGCRKRVKTKPDIIKKVSDAPCCRYVERNLRHTAPPIRAFPAGAKRARPPPHTPRRIDGERARPRRVSEPALVA